ncbi:hypothetical protein B6U79_01760, partial [Candidatus Bathyarchaeota archaeon ex4484_231]
MKGYNTTWGWGDYSCLEKVDVVVGIAESNQKNNRSLKPGITIYPNPFSKATSICYNPGTKTDDVSIKIYDTAGKLVCGFDHLANR